MKRSYLLLIPVLIATFICSCKKNSDDGEHNTVTPGSGYRSLDEAINSTAPIPKSTSLIVATGGRLTAPGGTVFDFPPNSFETMNGVQVTGSVQVTFIDWLKKGDMVFGRVLPLSAGVVAPYDVRPLASAGEAFIQVSQNGQVVRMRRGVHATVLFPQFGATPPATTGWVGRIVAGSASTVTWLEVDTVLLKPENLVSDTVTMRTDTLHYVQAATPLGFSGNSTFTVRLNSPVTLENTMAVALYDNNKALYPLPAAQNGVINVQRLPAGIPMHIAVMGINQGAFYAGIAAVPLPKSDSTYPVILKAIEPPTFKLQLNAL